MTSADDSDADVEAGTEEDAEDTASSGGGLGRRALLNAAQLGGSLMLTWILSLVGRFLLPNVLGSERFGELAFIEGIAVLTMSFMAFGVADYIRKEVAADRGQAVRIVRPVRRLQALSGILLTATFALAMLVTSGSEQAIVAVAFGLAQMTIVLGQVNAAYLQAAHEVRSVSLANIVTKIVWFVVLLAILGVGAELLALPLAILVSESIRMIWLQRSVRQEFGPPDPAPIKSIQPVLGASVPYFFNALNVLFLTYAIRIIIGLLATKETVGLFSTAEVAIAIPMLLTPVLGWIAIPFLSSVRATNTPEAGYGGDAELSLGAEHGGEAGRLDDESASADEQGIEVMWGRVRELVDLLAPTLVAAGVALFALSDPIMALLFADEFETAGPVFAYLALAVPLTYFTQLVGGAFIADDRSWQNTKVNLYTMLFVVVGVILVLAIGDATPGEYATRAAVVSALGEAITVAALIILRPFGRLRRATLGRIGIVMVALVVAFVEKAGDGSVAVAAGAAGIAVLVALSDVPRLLTQGRDTLRQGRMPESEEAESTAATAGSDDVE